MTDKEALEYFNNAIHVKWEKRDKKYINYLLERFNDFTVNSDIDRCKEALYRLKHNINKVPLCENCGRPLQYLIDAKFYESGCSKECKHILANKRLSETSFKKYGVKRPSQSQIAKERQKSTNLKKYNAASPLCDVEVKKKTKNTLLTKYNVDNIAKSSYWKDSLNNTSVKKYGTLYPNQAEVVKEKMKETLVLHYGVDNYLKTKEAKEKARSPESIAKAIQTKRKNNSFNKSKIEIDTLNILKVYYPDIQYQYKDKERYPFACDFYIPSLDLFIECNYHWTHGGKPFEGTVEDCEKLNKWKSKNTKFYNNAIICWTIRDVKKRNTAKQNNLNYIEIWDISEIDLILHYESENH